MSKKRVLPRFVSGLFCVALVAVLAVVGVTPASAQGNPPLWFQFNVGRVDPEKLTSHVSVVLRDQAQCKGGFRVYTADSWSYWGASTQGDPVGWSNAIGADMHMWAAELVPGAYYVRLGAGARPGCVLDVSGQAVDYVGLVDRGWRHAEQSRSFTLPVQVPPALTQVMVKETPVAASTRAAAIPIQIPAPAEPAVAMAAFSPMHHNMEHGMTRGPNE